MQMLCLDGCCVPYADTDEVSYARPQTARAARAGHVCCNISQLTALPVQMPMEAKRRPAHQARDFAFFDVLSKSSNDQSESACAILCQKRCS